MLLGLPPAQLMKNNLWSAHHNKIYVTIITVSKKYFYLIYQSLSPIQHLLFNFLSIGTEETFGCNIEHWAVLLIITSWGAGNYRIHKFWRFFWKNTFWILFFTSCFRLQCPEDERWWVLTYWHKFEDDLAQLVKESYLIL